jgi:hypothetical protein
MQRRAVGTRSVFLGLAVFALGACATTDVPEDTGWNVADAGRSDGAAMMDATRMDAPRDTPVDRGTTTPETGAMDVPRDVPRDIPVVDVPVDRGTTTPDTGSARCPMTCTNDVECSSMCPAAGAGYVNCCATGVGGGTCFQAMGSACPSTMPTDGGTTGSDSGFPLGGGPGAPCAADTDCSMGSTCCLMFSPGFGVCGCAVPIFGCIPPSGGSC